MDTPSYATGGRVGYYRGGGPTYNPFKVSQVPTNELGANIVSRNMPNELVDFRGKIDTVDLKEFLKPADITQQTDFKPKVYPGEIIKSKEETEAEKKELQSQQVDTGDLRVEAENEAALAAANKGTIGNAEEKVELSAQDLIRENAELFKELLNEGQKDRVKKARIGDASDYLLKFFEGSQKEGATVGSAAADVAGFATSKDSKTEKALAAKDKVDQTAVALAINDYVAGKRSKESIQQALAISAAKIKMAEGTIGDKILKAKGSGPVTVTVIRDVLRSEPSTNTDVYGKSIEEFNSKDKDFTGLKYAAGDENKIFIDTITKETFIYSPEIKDFKRIY